jgi:hypothetical protein
MNKSLHLAGLAGIAGLVLGSALWAMPATPAAEQPNRISDRVNPGQIKVSTNLREWTGLKCRVHLRVDFNPAAGSTSRTSGVSLSGLGSVNEFPTFVDGKLSATDADAIVITGPNGHVWIPRDQVRAIEVIQDPPTEPRTPPTTPPRH